MVDTMGRMTSTALYTRDAEGRVRRTRPDATRSLPPAWPVFLLGLIMPIDTIAGIPAAVMDVARYGLAGLILVAAHRSRREHQSPPIFVLAGGLLIACGVLSCVKAVVLGGSLLSATTALLSALVAFLFVRERLHLRALMAGFVFGCAWSALDIILQSSGLPFLGYASVDDFRYAGFSFSSTHVAPLLAVAICLVLTSWLWTRRRLVVRTVLLAVLGTGLFMSQGRVGVVGLLVALVVLAYSLASRRPAWAFGPVLVGVPVLYFTGAWSSLLDFMMRTDSPQTGEVTSGRAYLNAVAWDAFWQGGGIGVDPSQSYLYYPHMAPLTFALNLGPFGLFAVTCLCLLLAWVVLFGWQTPQVFRMIASVALVTALIEPLGFFVGFTGAVLVLLCFAMMGSQEHQYRQGSASSLRANLDPRAGLRARLRGDIQVCPDDADLPDTRHSSGKLRQGPEVHGAPLGVHSPRVTSVGRVVRGQGLPSEP